LNVRYNQPEYFGEWQSIEQADFRRAFEVLQAQIAPDGLAVLPVTLRSPDGAISAPAACMVRPAPEPDPYFRHAPEGLAAGVVHEPTRL
jgi:hypothetical protein